MKIMSTAAQASAFCVLLAFACAVRVAGDVWNWQVCTNAVEWQEIVGWRGGRRRPLRRRRGDAVKLALISKA